MAGARSSPTSAPPFGVRFWPLIAGKLDFQNLKPHAT
jgi:hypothetical protein